MAAGTPDDRFQKLKDENDRRRKKKEEEEKRRKQEEEQKAKEALERRRQERIEQDERMRKPWQQPPAPKKQILRKGANHKPVQPASPVVDAGRQADDKRRELRQGLQDFIKQQRQQTVAAVRGQPAAGPVAADGAAVVPLTWEELRMAAEAGFDELLTQQELQAEQRAAEEPTSRAARHRSPFKNAFKGAPAPPQDTVQVALVPTQQYNGILATGATAGPAHMSPRQTPDSHGPPPTAAPRNSYKYSDAPGWVGTAAAGAVTQEATLPWKQEELCQPDVGGTSAGGSRPFASGGQECGSHPHHAVDVITGDSGVDSPQPTVLHPPATSNTPRRGGLTDRFTESVGDVHGDMGVDVGVGGSDADAIVASSEGLRRGMTTAARHRASPIEPSLLDVVTPTLPAADLATDPWVRQQPPALDDLGRQGDDADTIALRSPAGQRLPLPGPYDSPLQQQRPHTGAAVEPQPPLAWTDQTPQPHQELSDDKLEASVQSGSTLAALQQPEGSRLTAPPLVQPPQPSLEASQLQPAEEYRSQDYPYNEATIAPPPPPPPLTQQPTRSDERHVRRGWGLPPQPVPGAAEAPLPPYAAAAGADAASPAWARDSFKGSEVSLMPQPLPPDDPSFTLQEGESSERESSSRTWLGRSSEAGSVQARSPAAIRHSVAVGDSGGPEMWQRESMAGPGSAFPLQPPPHQDAPSQRPLDADDRAHTIGAPLLPSVSTAEAAEDVEQQPEEQLRTSDLPQPPPAVELAVGQGGLAAGGHGAVNTSDDLVRFSSPSVGTSLAPSGSSSAAASPSPPANQSGGPELQQAESESRQELMQHPQYPQRQSRHRLSRVSYDGAAPGPEVGSVATEVGSDASSARDAFADPSTDPTADPTAETSVAQQQGSTRNGLQLSSAVHSVANDVPEPSPKPVPRSSFLPPQQQSPGPLLPPIPPTGRPLSGQSSRLSSSGGGLAASQIALPLISPHPPKPAVAEGEAALTVLPHTQPPQQLCVPPFRAPSPPASPSRSSCGVPQRPHRQLSGTSLLPATGSISAGGGGAGVSARPLSSDGRSPSTGHRAVLEAALLESPLPVQRRTEQGREVQREEAPEPIGPAAVAGPSPPMAAVPTAPEMPLQQVQRHRPHQQVQNRQQPKAITKQLQQLPSQFDSATRHPPTVNEPEVKAAVAEPAGSRKQSLVSTNPAQPSARTPTRPPSAAVEVQQLYQPLPQSLPQQQKQLQHQPLLQQQQQPLPPQQQKLLTTGLSTTSVNLLGVAQPQLNAVVSPANKSVRMDEQAAADAMSSLRTAERTSVQREPQDVAEESSESDEGLVSDVAPICSFPAAAGADHRAAQALYQPEVDGDLEGDLGERQEEEDVSSGIDGEGGGRGRGWRARLEESLERPPSTAEGSVLTGSHISARPWSGPSTGTAGGRFAGLGYQNSLLDDSVSSFDFRLRSAAASRPASASDLASCTPLPPSLAGPPLPLLYPTARAASSPARLADAAGGKSLANGPQTSEVGLPCKPSRVWSVPQQPMEALQGMRQEGAAGRPTAPAGMGLEVMHGSPSTAVGAAAHGSFPVLHGPTASRVSGASEMYGGGAGDNTSADWQPFVQAPVDELDALPNSGMAPPETALAVAATSASAPQDPAMEALMLEIQELSALRKALKTEFEMMGCGDAVAGLTTLSANFVDPASLPPLSEASGTGIGPVETDAAAAAAVAVAAPAPLLQWGRPTGGRTATTAAALMTPAQPAAVMPAPVLVATTLPNQVSTGGVHPAQQPSQHPPLAVPAEPHPFHTPQPDPKPTPLALQFPAATPLVGASPHSAAMTLQPPLPPFAHGAPQPSLSPPTAVTAPGPAPGPELGPGPGSWQTQGQGHNLADSSWAPAGESATGRGKDAEAGSFAYMAVGAAGLDSGSAVASSGLVSVQPATLLVVPGAIAQESSQSALQWTIPASSVNATPTQHKADGPLLPQQQRYKRSPTGGSYTVASAMGSPGAAPRRTNGTARTVGSAAGPTGRPAAAGNTSGAVPGLSSALPAERPLIIEGSYAAAAIQARERAERERAAREALQAESAAAKAAIIQRSRSERAAAAAAAAPWPSAGGAAITIKESSPLGPKAPSTIGSYVRQPSPARAAARSSVGGGTAGALSTPGSEASEVASSEPAAKQAWGTPMSTGRVSRIPTPQRLRGVAPAAAVAPTRATPPPPPSPPPAQEDSIDSDFEFLERASDLSDTETESPEAYGVLLKASRPQQPHRREAFASPSALPHQPQPSMPYRERLADVRPHPLRIPASAMATPMGGGASAASTIASRAVPTGGRGPSAGGGIGGRPGGSRGPSTPFTAAIRELMGLPGSAPLEQSRAAASKQQQQLSTATARGGHPAVPSSGVDAGGGVVDPILLLGDEEDKLLASLKRLDADILRRGLVVAGIINDPQLPSTAASATRHTSAPTVASSSPLGTAAKSGAVRPAVARGGGAARVLSPLTDSLQQNQLRDSLEKLDIRLAGLRRKMAEHTYGGENTLTSSAVVATGASASSQRESTPPREERRGPPATLAKSRTPTPNKAKAIRDQRQQQLSADQGPMPPPSRAPKASAQPLKPASAPTMGTMAGTADQFLQEQKQQQPSQQSLPPAVAAVAVAPPLGMPPRAPTAKAPASAPTGAVAMNAAQQQQQQQQQQMHQIQLQQHQMMVAAAVAAAGGAMPYGMMPMFAPPPPPPQPSGARPPSVAAAGPQQQVSYVPAMMPNGQMAFVPQYVQAAGAGACAPAVIPGGASGFPGFYPGAGSFSQAGMIQMQNPYPQQPQPPQQQQHEVMPPMMVMMPPGQQPAGQVPSGGMFPGGQQLIQQPQMPGGYGPMLAFGAPTPSQPMQLDFSSTPPQQMQSAPSYSSGGSSGGGAGVASLNSFDRSGPTTHARGSHDGLASGYGRVQLQQQQHHYQQQGTSQLSYVTGALPNGPMPYYHTTVMRSRSIGSRDGEAVLVAAAAAGFTQHQNHQPLQQMQQQQQQQQQQQEHNLPHQQGHSNMYPHQHQPVTQQQQARESYSVQQQPSGHGQRHGLSSQSHPVQVQSYGPNGISRGLGSAVGGWGMANAAGGGGGSSTGNEEAGVIKAVNLGLLLS